MRLTAALLVVAALTVVAGLGCTRQSQPAVVSRPDVEVRYSSLDVRAARATSLVAPAMVAIYAIDDQEYTTFDRDLSTDARQQVNTFLQYRAPAPILDLKRVDSTPLIAGEFYNRMDGATSVATNYCLSNHVCSKDALSFGLPVTQKLTTWSAPLGVRYVVFLRIYGAHRTQGYRVLPAGAIPAALSIGLFHAIYGYAGPAGAVASASVVDLSDGRIVWFKVTPISDSRSIPKMTQALEVLLRDLY